MGNAYKIKDIGEKISAWRKYRGLSMKQLGDLTDNDRSAVWKWEANQVVLPISTIEKICEALQVHPATMVSVGLEDIPTSIEVADDQG